MACNVLLSVVDNRDLRRAGYALALGFCTGCEMKARSQRKRARERDPDRERVGGRGPSASRVGPRLRPPIASL